MFIASLEDRDRREVSKNEMDMLASNDPVGSNYLESSELGASLRRWV
jgi:hypothetical protein